MGVQHETPREIHWIHRRTCKTSTKRDITVLSSLDEFAEFAPSEPSWCRSYLDSDPHRGLIGLCDFVSPDEKMFILFPCPLGNPETLIAHHLGISWN